MIGDWGDCIISCRYRFMGDYIRLLFWNYWNIIELILIWLGKMFYFVVKYFEGFVELMFFGYFYLCGLMIVFME